MNEFDSIISEIKKQYDIKVVKKLLLIKEKALRDGELTLYNILDGLSTESIELVKLKLLKEGYIISIDNPKVEKYVKDEYGSYGIKIEAGKVRVFKQIYKV